ncbi:MAG: hypothetical protein J6B02_05915, partial [Selenomonadales bacterium]|nr:hypothetical protein [Selenomonadales bacterium]
PDYTVVRLGSDGQLPSLLELTCRHGEPIINTEFDRCLDLAVEDYEAALAYHRAMGCVYEKDVESDNYCIRDLDHRGIWIYPKFSAVRDDLVSFVDEEEA